jgi:tetratricopeptide (TPR) repeat protein
MTVQNWASNTSFFATIPYRRDIRFYFLLYSCLIRSLNMERLHQLLHALDPQQVKVLKNYLTGFSTRDPNTKFWGLAALMLKDKQKQPSLKRCSMVLYGTKPDGRIERLKNRLYSKVLDSLLIDINTNRDIYEDETHPIQVRLRKKMILYDLLKFTPLKQTVGLEMINDIISTAKQYEFHSILLDAMYIYKGNYGIMKGIDFFRKTNTEIEYYEKCKRYAQRAFDLSTEMGMISTFNTKADKTKIENFVSASLAELRAYYLETNVKLVGYFLKTFEMTHHQMHKRFHEAKEVGLSMLEFMKHNKTIGRKGRFGVWNSYVAECDLQMGDYESAIKHIHLGQEYFSGSPVNLAINRKLEADAYFLKGDYTKTLEIASLLASDDSQVTGNFRRDIMLYYKGCCQFMLGEFREAARLFNLKFQITQDKLGWEVNIRFMRIMTMIELNRPDEAHAMVETTSKHIERYQQVAYLNARDKILLKLFRELAREGFAFDRPGDKTYHYLLQLQEKDKDHSWEPLTPELIPIHTWVIKKYGKLLPPAVDLKKEKKTFKTAARKSLE